MTYKEKIKLVFKYFGWEEQRRKLQEEVDEFKDEILLFEKGIGNIEKLKEEFRDVNVVLDGFREIYEILIEEDINTKNYKVDRVLQRIKDGYYVKGK